MIANRIVSKTSIRSDFTSAMSQMYRQEVPKYKDLYDLVQESNKQHKQREQEDLEIERHGAIRLGSASEIFNMRRLFAVMDMYPVDYYDLSIAGIPVHSTAFRAIDNSSLNKAPFRVFTSLLRLDLIMDLALRKKAKKILLQRKIFSESILELINKSELSDGLSKVEAHDFVSEALEIFRWHQSSTVEKEDYEVLHAVHPLIADIVCFKGPHINHLTPATLNIDSVQKQLSKRKFHAKKVIEGPPKRASPILLRQTSFMALEEPVVYKDGKFGVHKARFGEVEERGIALTPKGRALYDELLEKARSNGEDYETKLKTAFMDFPDSYEELREQQLAYFEYSLTTKKVTKQMDKVTLKSLIDDGYLTYKPITYQDFLPVSAAGIFQSNLVADKNQAIQQNPNKAKFEKDLGVSVYKSFELYEAIQKLSLEQSMKQLGVAIN